MSRHASVAGVAVYLTEVNPKLDETQFNIAVACKELAEEMLSQLEDSAELTAGLRKLLEAKDCFVRASLDL